MVKKSPATARKRSVLWHTSTFLGILTSQCQTTYPTRWLGTTLRSKYWFNWIILHGFIVFPKKPIGVSIQQLVFIGSGLMKFNRHWQRAWMKNARCWFGKKQGMSTQPSLWYGGRYQYIKVCTTFLDLNLTDFSLF